MVLSFLGGVLGSIAFLGIIGAQPASKNGFFKQVSADTVVAKNILILDTDKVSASKGGTMAAKIEATEDGGALSIYSSRGVVRLGASSLGAHLFVEGIAGKGAVPAAVALVAHKDGADVSVESGTSNAMLWASDGGANITVGPHGEAKGPNASVTYISKVPTASLGITDAGGQTRVVAGQTGLVTKASGVREETPVGSITIFDEVGNVVWRQPR
jgi:hypothetical protein